MTEKKLNTKNNKNLPPINWVETTLGKVIKIGRGSSPRPIQNYIVEKKGIPWVKIADATASRSRYIEKTKEFIKEEGRSTSVSPGDLIVSNSATPGIPKFMKIEACVHDGWLVFSEYKNLDKLYLYYFFLDYRIRLERSAFGTVFKNLTTEIVRSVPIFLPPLREQKAIASLLSAYDDKIELLKYQNKTLEEIGQVIFQEWFGKYELDDFIKVQEILEFEKGVEIGSNNYFVNKNDLEKPEMFYRVGDIANNGNNSSIYCEKDLLKGKIFKNDDVLVSFDGTVGRVFIGGNGGYSSGIRKIFDKNVNIKNSFLYFWAKSEQVQETINLYSEGTTIQHAGRSIPYLEIISNRENIDEITESLNPVFIKILENLNQIRILSSARDEILPKLMSGIVRVNDFSSN
ncbi:restriction endonuclease subunit S [Patescibacteria group bacterium]|nr:restriction endonuclease subunit S [Patescibacteria group bacterium]